MTQKSHILLVEDEEHLATGIKYNLDAEGYTVTTVTDGRKALTILENQTNKIDLLILDLMLPGMSGYAVCESLRAKDKKLPVLMLSARTLAEDRARGFDAGANQYLTKPFDLDELLSRVNNLLTLHAVRLEQETDDPKKIDMLEFGNATINFKTFEVTVGDRSVRMTQLEMNLMRYFSENEGRVIPRQELLEKVWGLAGKLHTRAPDQFIRRLRKIFESNATQPRHFLTIRDAGYRFVMDPNRDHD